MLTVGIYTLICIAAFVQAFRFAIASNEAAVFGHDELYGRFTAAGALVCLGIAVLAGTAGIYFCGQI